MSLNIGTQHQALMYYQVCSNDDNHIGLTFYLFTEGQICSLGIYMRKSLETGLFGNIPNCPGMQSVLFRTKKSKKVCLWRFYIFSGIFSGPFLQ